MNTIFHRFLSSVPRGVTVLLLLFAGAYPLAEAGKALHLFDLYAWLALVPGLVWKGQIWRLVTYAFLANGIVDWVVSLFWLATLVAVLGRNWSGRELWSYCLLAAITGAIIIAGSLPGLRLGVAGNGAIIFALLAAWYRLYGNERLILLGIGEISVRQAVVLITFIEVLILLFCLGWLITLAMMCGGAVGWFYLFFRSKHAWNRRSQQVESERIARLEI